MEEIDENDIAIVGMGIRVSGANNPDEYWRNLIEGVESVVSYSDDELLGRGVSKRTLADPNYVKAGLPLQNLDQFDPEFFGFSPKEAAILDPQHRQFYEVAWEALERAGHTPQKFDGSIGVFAGCGMGAYFSFNLLSNQDLIDNVGMFLLRHTGNDKDFLSTRVSYSFNLQGPSINVQTACSTSLVATHLAAQSLLSFECDMALAGGVTIDIPHQVGYVYKEGEVLSPDGHCRAFDHKSKGTVFGSGAGVVVLRRLSDAIADGHHIHAVIKGSAINNDGSNKVGYLAPSVEGQAAAIAEAIAVADVSADTIGYVECHGTGTPVGDPIEISALTRAFRESTDESGYCRIGSVKTNIGHLDTAAGVASLIKTTLAIEHGEIPPSLNFEAANPQIDFQSSPFLVCDKRMAWDHRPGPRRAGINSLGVGGTNAFLILEQAPAVGVPEPNREDAEFLMLSARTKQSLDGYSERLADWLEKHHDTPLSDVSHTLARGRKAFEYRRIIASQSHDEAARLLREKDPRRTFNINGDEIEPAIAFLLPGGGAQYFQMGQDLYRTNSLFREHMDRGLEVLAGRWGADLAPVFHAGDEHEEQVTEQLDQPSIQLPLTFLVEYALAQVWQTRGVAPDALIGHSMGENTAACLAGVMSFEDTLGLVLLRGQLFETTPPGGVLSVPMPAEELRVFIGEGLDLATSNSPSLSVASGPSEALDALAARLAEDGTDSQRVRVNVAAHSRLLDGILDQFRSRLQSMQLNPPQIPIVSNLTGDWLTEGQAQSPDYWIDHLRGTVLFSDGIQTLLQNDQRVFLEVGPGNTLGSFVRQQPDAIPQRVVSSMRHPQDTAADDVYLSAAIGRLWALNLKLPVEKIWPERRLRIPLPTYAFQHARYWVDPGQVSDSASAEYLLPERCENVDDWFFEPKWIAQGIAETDPRPRTILFFENDEPVSAALMERLRLEGSCVLQVRPGDIYLNHGDDTFTIAPETGIEGYDQLLAELSDEQLFPDQIVHAWLLTWDTSYRPGSSFFHRLQNQGFYSLFYLAKALGKRERENHLHLTVLTNNAQSVAGEVIEHPDKATAMGPVQVIPRELPDISCKLVDLATGRGARGVLSKRTAPVADTALIENILDELAAPGENSIVAWRDNVRYLRQVVRRRKAVNTKGLPLLKKEGVYLLTGGFGGIATVIADWLAESYQAKLVLVGRTPLPNREDWDEWLIEHEPDDAISQLIGRVQLLESQGTEVMALSADVTVTEQMEDVLRVVKARFGVVNGIFHTAGTLRDSLIAMKSQREIEDVFSAKVYGSLVLDEVFGGEPMDFVVLFGSSSAFIAPQGQVDYVAANNFMNALACARTNTRPYPTIALNWGIWRDVGMVAPQDAQDDQLDAQQQPQHPLFLQHLAGHEGLREIHRFEGELSATDWVIDEHRLKNGDALLPGTGYIELIRAALEEVGNAKPWRLDNLTFERPLFVPDGESVIFSVALHGNRDNWRAEVSCRDEASGHWEVCVKARVRNCPDGAQQVDLAALGARTMSTGASAAGTSHLRTRQEDHLNFGPRWHVLRQQSLGESEAIGNLRLPDEFAEDLEAYRLHPGMLDIATGYAMDLIPGYAAQEVVEHLWVPLSYARFDYFAPLPAEISSWVRLHPDSRPDLGMVAFDVTLIDDKGQALAEIDRLTLRKTEGQFSRNSGARDDAQVVGAERLSPGEIALAHNVTQGINAQGGLQALQQVLSNPAPAQLIVSSMNMNDLLHQADYLAEQAAQVSEIACFERPELESEFEAARDEIERVMAEVWGKLLGVEGIGIHDSFFDLGGHSLIAVRLFNDIRERFGHDLPISALMQSPTISDLAQIVRGGPVGEPDAAQATAPAGDAQPQFQYIVPMHSTAVGSGTPLFMVAGMFGNVLNLSHLAHLLGEERPFYALQARGLYGDSEPHETFEETARDYIAEMRLVQPEGPYLIGGYSGGGLITFEIASQLLALGERVFGIILLDTPAPSFPTYSLADKVSMVMQGIRKNGVAYIIDKFRTRVRWEKEKRERADANDDPLSFQSQKIGAAFMRALRQYNVPRLGAPVAVFRPKLNVEFTLSRGRQVDIERNYVFEDNGWSEFASELTITEIPGNHDSMVLEPNVRVLVNSMRRYVSSLEQKGAATKDAQMDAA